MTSAEQGAAGRSIAADLRMSRLGLGTAPLGGLFRPISDPDAEATLVAAWQQGIRYFDTAPLYGSGLAENRLGRFLLGKPRSQFIVSTKVGRRLIPDAGVTVHNGYHGDPYLPIFDFGESGIRRSLDGSLRRLNLDHVDIAFLHDPDDNFEQAVDESYPTLRALQDEGLVRAIGVGMNHARLLARFVDTVDLDCVLIAGRYTVLDRSAEQELLPLCADRGVAVVVGGVFNSGLLIDADPSAPYDYGRAKPSILQDATQLRERCAANGTPLGAVAIQMPLRHPAVTCVLVGARSADEANIDASWYRRTVPPELWREMDRAATTFPAPRRQSLS